MSNPSPAILALNCGSSSIKAKLYILPPKGSSNDPKPLASASISNINAQGEKLKIKLQWADNKGKDLDEDGDDGDEVKHLDLIPLLLDKLTSAGPVDKDDVKYVVHRIVHGGTHKKGITVTKDHTEGLQEMDKLSEFAPLHNHHAVLAVKSCLDALPNHTSIMVFDTLFHQTIPPETYTYALPPPEIKTQMPLRKYGFHGLSYASIVRTLAQHRGVSEKDVNLVVAHLGSGASACCIKGGKSIDTSMGLTPLEGLLGGTRSGTIDPTAIFHHTSSPSTDAGLSGMRVSKAEMTLNKHSGLLALAGTTNFGTILSQKADNERYQLAYDVYVDRLMGYLSQYLCKLLVDVKVEDIDIVFSGGIGEKAGQLRKDVLGRLGWLGVRIDERGNGEMEGEVRRISAEDSTVRAWVVETDEEGWSVQLARDTLDI